jgi:hypothetical protein
MMKHRMIYSEWTKSVTEVGAAEFAALETVGELACLVTGAEPGES